ADNIISLAKAAAARAVARPPPEPERQSACSLWQHAQRLASVSPAFARLPEDERNALLGLLVLGEQQAGRPDALDEFLHGEAEKLAAIAGALRFAMMKLDAYGGALSAEQKRRIDASLASRAISLV